MGDEFLLIAASYSSPRRSHLQTFYEANKLNLFQIDFHSQKLHLTIAS